MNFPKLPPAQNLTNLVYESLKRHLLYGELKSGTRLTEENLARDLGVSKSPVREALNRLESEGLIVIESRRGAHVRQFTAQEASEVYDLRELLEVHAVGLVKVTPPLLRRLAESIELTRGHLANGDKAAHVEEDIRFHGIIARGTENFELYRILENLQQKCLLARTQTYYLSGTTAPVSHQKVYRALKAGNHPAAQKAMREHITFVRESLLHSLETPATQVPSSEEESSIATAG